ncbi:MAG TPA: hypothetical protein VFX16_31490 [Pseudonocardiaceae bacterium]|nr:hypothetical protein [Pseudonocardiaceae bacterium]
MSEPYDYRGQAPSQAGRPQGWAGTSRMPTQALGAPPPDLQPSSDYRPYGQPDRPSGNRGSGGFGKDRSKLLDYALKGLGLVGVALVSGFLWFLIRNNPATPARAQTSPPASQTGLYAFQAYNNASTVTDCTDHASDKVKNYLAAHPCVSLTRSLFTASVAGQKVVTSVAVVRMDSAASAVALRKISDGNGTGHVHDLVEDGVVIPGGPHSLQNAGYFSKVKGARLIIVMTEYVDGNADTKTNLDANDTTLRGVSSDAAKQGLGGSG